MTTKPYTRCYNDSKDKVRVPYFSFYVYELKQQVNDRNHLWNRVLPYSKEGRNQGVSDKQVQRFTYGDYFNGLTYILKRKNFCLLTEAVGTLLGRFVIIDEITSVSICLKKHGAFYHPAKLEILLNDSLLTFVINVAVSKEGRSCIRKEVDALILLNKDVPLGYLPQVYVYCFDEPYLLYHLSVFIGEWFIDFNEFHLSPIAESGNNKIVVWDSVSKRSVLSENQTNEIYRQSSMIVSLYYDPRTTEQIFPWNNASGDFVIKVDGDKVFIKLVSARNFTPMLPGFYDECTENLVIEEVLYALTIFFLHLSIRVRLDRLDGVGIVVMGDEKYIPSIVQGFFQGLELIIKKVELSHKFSRFFREYLLKYKKEDLSVLFFEIINKIYKKREEDFFLIHENIDKHLECFCRALEKLDKCH